MSTLIIKNVDINMLAKQVQKLTELADTQMTKGKHRNQRDLVEVAEDLYGLLDMLSDACVVAEDK